MRLFVLPLLVLSGCAVGGDITDPGAGPELTPLRTVTLGPTTLAPPAWPEPVAPAPGTWIRVEPGSFEMGVPAGDDCSRTETGPRHHVTLTRAFEMMDAEITQGDWREVMGGLQTGFTDGISGDAYPADMLDWHRAAAYCDALSELTGLPHCYACESSRDATRCRDAGSPYECAGYRLPTEAEWEYAYRAGTSTHFHNGDITVCNALDPALDRIAWFLFNAGGRTHPVRERSPNAFGFFDLSGNVWEWTHDGMSELGQDAVDPVAPSVDGFRVMRGGSFNCVPAENRADHRVGLPDTIAGLNVGARCARTLPPGT
jgi:formylglycine-generating enzyme required for sulfatase activity